MPIGNSAELRRLGLGARLGQKPGADLAEYASLLGGVALVAGLKGLDPGRKVMVVFHFHRAPGQYDLRQHPRGDSSRPRVMVCGACPASYSAGRFAKPGVGLMASTKMVVYEQAAPGRDWVGYACTVPARGSVTPPAGGSSPNKGDYRSSSAASHLPMNSLPRVVNS